MVILPVYDRAEEAIYLIWHFYFEEGEIKYRPLTLDEVKRVDAGSEWMFEYFTHDVLGNKHPDGVTYRSRATEPSMLRTWQEVVTCVDAFVNDVFKGTHCWSSGVEWVPDDRPGNIEHTVSGSGAGGYTGKIPSNSTFMSFPLLSDIYGMNSTMSRGQKLFLESAMSEFLDFSSNYRMIMDWFKQENVKINFNIKAHVLLLPNGERDTVASTFDIGNQSIDFKNEENLTLRNLSEELVHAFQYFRFYHDVMNSNDKDYEFEAKVYKDLAALFDDNIYSNPLGYLFLGYTENEALEKDYWLWIELLETQGGLYPGDLDEYYRIGLKWDHPNYRGVFRRLEAKMLKQVFRKK